MIWDDACKFIRGRRNNFTKKGGTRFRCSAQLKIPNDYYLCPVVDPLILIHRFTKAATSRGQEEGRRNGWKLFKRVGTRKQKCRGGSFVSVREPEAGCFLAGLNKVCPRLSKYSKDSARAVLRPPSLSLSLAVSSFRVRTRSWHERNDTNEWNA